jgi:SAM-dependent methyltransferase
VFGFDRGLCIDRYYIERFLAANAAEIHGSVLEAGDSSYTRRFGGTRVQRSEVIDVGHDNPNATIVADLMNAVDIPDETFDCAVLTQTLQMIEEPVTALREVRRILKPGGTLLLTVPAISQISRWDADRWGDLWRFTSQGLAHLSARAFTDDEVTVAAYGNVLAATAFLHGLAAAELTPQELDFVDPDYELVVALRARKR